MRTPETESHAEKVRTILADSDAVCGGCGRDPRGRGISFASLCTEWFFDLEGFCGDYQTAIVRCPKCW